MSTTTTRQPMTLAEKLAAIHELGLGEPRILPHPTSRTVPYVCRVFGLTRSDGVSNYEIVVHGWERNDMFTDFWSAIAFLPQGQYLLLNSGVGTGKLAVVWDHAARAWLPIIRKQEHDHAD